MNNSLASAEESLKRLLSRKDILIFLGVLLLGLFLANSLFQKQRNKLKALKSEIALLEQRVKLGKEVVGLQEEFIRVSAPYLKKATSFTIDKFSESASANRVKITSISQEGEVDAGLYTVMSYHLSLKAGYHNLGRFIGALESLADMVKVEELSIQAGRQAMSQKGGEAENILSVSMKVSVTFIKTE